MVEFEVINDKAVYQWSHDAFVDRTSFLGNVYMMVALELPRTPSPSLHDANRMLRTERERPR